MYIKNYIISHTRKTKTNDYRIEDYRRFLEKKYIQEMINYTHHLSNMHKVFILHVY